MPKLMYKDGITRTVPDFEVQKFKDYGYVEVAKKEDKNSDDPQKNKKNVD